MAIKKSSSSGIPSGLSAGRPANPGFGQLYANGETARLELFTQVSGWQNIVQETPGVSSITGNYLESTDSGTITIYGTNFVSGAYATAIGTNGVQIDAASTTFNSLVQLTATFTGLSSANEPYNIKVTNPSNLFGMLVDALYVNNNPTWTTPAGSLGTFAEQVNATIYALGVSDESVITYSLDSGSTLPSGVTLSSAGVISGTLPDISSNTTYTFTVNATDGLNPVISRTFSFVSNAAPIWVTSAGYLGSYLNNTSVTLSALSATDTDTVTYALANGSSLPGTLSLNSSTGVISGTLPTVAIATQYNFTVNALDGFNTIPRSFSLTSVAQIEYELLVVAGGGGGGSQVGGGGGAGGLIYSSAYNITRGISLPVSVGTGGVGGPWQGAGSRPGDYGTNTVFGSWTAFGGGGGGGHGSNSPASGADGLITQSGRPGGSGGGGGANSSNGAAGSATQTSPSGGTGYGFSGGTGFVSNWSGGGGGGSGSAGSNSTASYGGAGGSGKQYSITGTSLFYAAGGGGCGDLGLDSGAQGGSGIGGNGVGNSANTSTKYATDGAANTGSGGGGTRDSGPAGDGGSGVVIIAYPNTFPALTTIPETLTYDQPTRSGYRVYRFTAGSGTITI